MTTNAINNSSSSLEAGDILISGFTVASPVNTDLTLAPNGTGKIQPTNCSIIPSTDRTQDLGNTTNTWGNIYATGLSFDDGTSIFSNYIPKTSFVSGLDLESGLPNDMTFSVNEGVYSITGKMVFFSINLVVDSVGTGVGIFNFILPPTFDVNVSYSLRSVYASNINYTGQFGPGIYIIAVVANPISNYDRRLQTITSNDEVSNMEISNLSSGSVMRIVGSYNI